MTNGATITSLYHACVDHNARLPNFLRELFFHAMLQRKLDMRVCFSLLNIWSFSIFQQLILTAAATSVIAAAVPIKEFLHLCIY
jgi:hypothetical protein